MVKSARSDLPRIGQVAEGYTPSVSSLRTMSRTHSMVSTLLLPSESSSAILFPDSSEISFSKTFLFGFFAFFVSVIVFLLNMVYII